MTYQQRDRAPAGRSEEIGSVVRRELAHRERPATCTSPGPPCSRRQGGRSTLNGFGVRSCFRAQAIKDSWPQKGIRSALRTAKGSGWPDISGGHQERGPADRETRMFQHRRIAGLGAETRCYYSGEAGTPRAREISRTISSGRLGRQLRGRNGEWRPPRKKACLNISNMSFRGVDGGESSQYRSTKGDRRTTGSGCASGSDGTESRAHAAGTGRQAGSGQACASAWERIFNHSRRDSITPSPALEEADGGGSGVCFIRGLRRPEKSWVYDQ